jgi:hypothetical protein
MFVVSRDGPPQDDTGKLSQTRRDCHLPLVGSVEVRPTVDFLIKGGIPAYFMVGLEAKKVEVVCPLLAQQWTTFGMAVEPNMRLLVYVGAGDGTDERLAHFGRDSVQEVLERLGVLLSDTATDDFATGFHIVSLPISNDWITLSSAHQHDSLTCFATAEPDARELFTIDDNLLEMTATSMLQLKLSDLMEATSECEQEGISTEDYGG